MHSVNLPGTTDTNADNLLQDLNCLSASRSEKDDLA